MASRWDFSVSYESEDTGRALQRHGAVAPNPGEEVVDFSTTTFGLRYGVSRNMNMTVSVPYHAISSNKIQGEYYSRVNNGVGDAVLTAEMAVLSSPHLTVEAGVKFGNGSVDRTDAFGQRICDILSLGSGTTDFLIGSNLWVPKIGGITGLQLTAGVRHRFSSGQNKWGYAYGDQTVFQTHMNYLMAKTLRLGVRIDGYHTVRDTWYDLEVADRGATFIYASPTLSWNLRDDVSVGGFVRVPLYMDMVGSQMVASYSVGVQMTANLTPLIEGVLQPLGVD